LTDKRFESEQQWST